MSRARRGQAGFTLIELMVGVVLTALVVGLAMQIGIPITGAFRSMREAQTAERGARAGMEVLADAVRSASSSVTTGDLRDASHCTTAAGIAIENHGDAPDALTVLYASGGVLTSLRSVFLGSSTSFDVLESAGLVAGDMVIISNGDVGRMVTIRALSAATGPATATTDAPTTACPNVLFPTAGFAVGSLVLRGKVARFYVANASDGTPFLWMDPDGNGPAAAQPLAEGVEDMQVAVGIDLDGDGVLREDGTATDEWFYNNPGDPAPPDPTTTRWTTVRISLFARTYTDLASNPPESARAAGEDRAAGAMDVYRRRVLTTTVDIRNLEQNP
ncbi:MAG: PilW family protein [Deltaproteobacteria bacterium]|nr:PilW family protein [Deltaproteobacteria bacterium]